MLGALFISFFSCTKTERSIELLKPVEFNRVKIGGELYQRAMKNFDRLETKIYYPENVFPEQHHPSSAGWPGDKEGRTILGLVMEAQATHRSPKYLEEMIRILPKKLNARGYLGAIQGDTINEQQLSGHGWLLRGLCEYYLWKKEPKVKTYIQGIVQNLALPTKGHHQNYPINPKERIAGTGEMSGSAANVVNGWKLSTDVGCDFIFMDGVVQAYALFPSEDLKKLIDEMISRFLEMDLVLIKAQTHATLTGLRAVLRYYEITGEKKLLQEVKKRYDLYRKQAMTENYENFNWFERPEWTEPCAIVDSYLLAFQLWQYTQCSQYLEDAQLIYYNAICHTQRSNGGFGCDNCPGPVDNFLSVKADEAFWCCTMRGGEGLARAVEYSYFQQKDTLYIPAFYEGSVVLQLSNGETKVTQHTHYPFENKVTLHIDSRATSSKLPLKLFVPSWIEHPVVSVNHKKVAITEEKGFLTLATGLKTGDVLEYSFSFRSGAEHVANKSHSVTQNVRLFYGPLILGYEGAAEIKLPNDISIQKENNHSFRIVETDIRLSPVYHLLDAKVCKGSGYRKQVLFQNVGETIER